MSNKNLTKQNNNLSKKENRQCKERKYERELRVEKDRTIYKETVTEKY